MIKTLNYWTNLGKKTQKCAELKVFINIFDDTWILGQLGHFCHGSCAQKHHLGGAVVTTLLSLLMQQGGGSSPLRAVSELPPTYQTPTVCRYPKDSKTGCSALEPSEVFGSTNVTDRI